MNNDFFREVSKFSFLINSFPADSILVSGGVGNQNYPGAGGYGFDDQNAGGAKQQLLSLIRSVRTVMRGKIIHFIHPI